MGDSFFMTLQHNNIFERAIAHTFFLRSKVVDLHVEKEAAEPRNVSKAETKLGSKGGP
jgi:hypothetical protein